ncbi:LOW QUALITY PROTEIN: hypothetical protein V1478_000920 [Vespula squamosa]|uniref:Uncharacterized protein n=1 Tax=Vespula squamosa TaxID=30214 RepID=A0ABD2C6Z6_VESSQ
MLIREAKVNERDPDGGGCQERWQLVVVNSSHRFGEIRENAFAFARELSSLELSPGSTRTLDEGNPPVDDLEANYVRRPGVQRTQIPYIYCCSFRQIHAREEESNGQVSKHVGKKKVINRVPKRLQKKEFAFIKHIVQGPGKSGSLFQIPSGSTRGIKDVIFRTKIKKMKKEKTLNKKGSKEAKAQPDPDDRDSFIPSLPSWSVKANIVSRISLIKKKKEEKEDKEIKSQSSGNLQKSGNLYRGKHSRKDLEKRIKPRSICWSSVLSATKSRVKMDALVPTIVSFQGDACANTMLIFSVARSCPRTKHFY